MPDEHGGENIDVLAERVFASAKSTAFALMKANYIERKAWELPGGKIRGLAPEARDIAVALRDSIWSRFDSLRFHHGLILRVLEHGRQVGGGDTEERFKASWSAFWHAHYLFDDVIFNAASLFDYIGNAVWFGFHGQNHVKKKWSKAYEAAKRPDLEANLPTGPSIHTSATGAVILAAHQNVVNGLYGYRSELIHNRIDGPDVFSHRFWEENARSGFQLPLPKTCAKRLKKMLSSRGDADGPIDMPRGVEHLVLRCGQVAAELLEQLRKDLGYDESEPLTFLS